MCEDLVNRDDSVSAGYIHEKSGFVIDRLVDILQILEDQDISCEEKEKQIHGIVEAALGNALKIIATTTGSHWDPMDCELIANCGDAQEGWNAIKYKYSQDAKKQWYRNIPENKKEIFYQTLLKYHTVFKAEIAVRKDFCSKLRPLLGEHRGEARTKINVIMDSYSLQDKCFLRMNHLLDQVNMGIITWSDFCLRFTANLSYLESAMNSEDAEHYIFNLFSDEEKRRKAERKGWPFEEYDPSNVPQWEHCYLQEHNPDSNE